MRKLLVYLIKLYQRLLSPHLPQSCRFHPSCSKYAMEALERYGVIKGLALSLWRVLRCNPLHPGGYDPLK